MLDTDLLSIIDPFAAMTSSFSFEGARPPRAPSSKSFSRYEPPKSTTPTRSRASTLQNEALSNIGHPEKAESDALHPGQSAHEGDVFEKRNSEDDKGVPKPVNSSPLVGGLPDGFDELPIELISLTDR